MTALYESYAIYAEQTGADLNPPLDTEEMRPYMANRIFNKVEAHYGHAIHIKAGSNAERIVLQPGVYRINGLSFLTMLTVGTPPVPPVPLQNLNDIYPGYCILYDAANPPSPDDMSGAICIGTMGTAYDSGPSIFDCVLKVAGKPMEISLGHQCTYENHTEEDAPAFLRIGGSDYHVSARIAIFKIG